MKTVTVGDRIKVIAGRNKGKTGVVEFIEGDGPFPIHVTYDGDLASDILADREVELSHD